MALDSLLNQRFLVEAEVGRGGMGRVLKAQDLSSGQPVAVKILLTPRHRGRFDREVEIMASLSHPAIVSYVDRGSTLDGRPFMVMEWLNGADLAQRLRHAGLRLHESLTVIRCAAEALGVAHRKGIVHRDIKPSNLFLREEQPERLALIDFGIACEAHQKDNLTQAGQVLGTPKYMSPEQARADLGIGPTSDLFSLGCILYECLSGQVPHEGEHLAAVIGKLLYSQPSGLRQVRPDLPEEVDVLDSILSRMLAKEPADRFQNTDELLAALDSLPPLPDVQPPSLLRGEQTVAIAEEQRLVSVVVALPPGAYGGEMGTLDVDIGTTERTGTKTPYMNNQELAAALGALGAQLEQLADGSMIVTARSTEEIHVDPVMRAACCAFLIKDNMPELRIALATGRALLHDRIPQGEVMERIDALLNQTRDLEDSVPVGIWADEVSGNLLDARYAMQRYGRICLLQGELDQGEESRALLGKLTPCVGRERELALLDMLADTSQADSVARAALVLAPAGMGKSRLRHEFVRRLRQRQSETTVAIGRADAISAGASYGLMAAIVRDLCGIVGGEPLPERQSKLRSRVASRVADADLERVVVFLGEVCGCQFLDSELPLLRAARQDPRILGAQIEQALLDLLRAECQAHPLVLILEDLHWGDILTVRLFKEALGLLAERSLFVLAMARPEVQESFPNLWEERAVQVIRLPRLPSKAAERLIEYTLGDTLSPKVRAQLVAQAGGNALLLEELIREAAEGRISDQPATVMAVLQGRIDRLDIGARRVLRAASVYGEVFWQRGIGAILSDDTSFDELEQWLEVLQQQELIERRRDCRFAEEVEYSFRHALVREAAYLLLTDADRPRRHRAALSYLVSAGESDPLVLAGHAERSGQHEPATRYYAAAARQSFNRNDAENAESYAERAIGHGATGDLFAELRYIQASSAQLLQKNESLSHYIADALNAATPCGKVWCQAYGHILASSFFKDPLEVFAERARFYLKSTPHPDAISKYLVACSLILSFACQCGLMSLASDIIKRIDEFASQATSESDPAVYSQIMHTRAKISRSTKVNPAKEEYDSEEAYKYSKIGFPQMEGDMIAAARACTIGELGNLQYGISLMREISARYQNGRTQFLKSMCALHLSDLLIQSEEGDNLLEAQSLIRDILTVPTLSNAYRGWAHAMLGQVALLQGDSEAATREARTGLPLLNPRPFLHIVAQTTLIGALRAGGQLEEARGEAQLALSALRKLSEQSYPALPLFVEVAQVYHQSGDFVLAHRILADCLAEMERRADLTADSAARERFLQGIPTHRRAAALAQAWQIER